MTSERASEQLAAYGVAGLNDAELLGLVLRGPSFPADEATAFAGDLLGRYGDLRKLQTATYDELLQLDRVTDDRAYRLVAVSELARRTMTVPLNRGEPMRGGADVFRAYYPRLRDLGKERFYGVLVDGKHRVLREILVSEGTLTSSPVHPRETYREAIRDGAAGLVCVHNHPSGDPSPSADDLDITHRLAQVGDLVGIRLLDHVIVGDGAYVSLADRGLLR